MPKLADYLRIRRVYRTPWPGIYEVIDTAGKTRHRVVVTGEAAGICSCKRGRFDQPCRHLVLVLMRRGGAYVRGTDHPHRRGGTVAA